MRSRFFSNAIVARMRERRRGYPRPAEAAFAAVLRDLALTGATGHAFEDVFLAMANDGMAPTAASIDAVLAYPGHPDHISIVQRLFNAHAQRPSLDLFQANVLAHHLATGDHDEARRAAAVLGQLWPDGAPGAPSRASLEALFADHGADLF